MIMKNATIGEEVPSTPGGSSQPSILVHPSYLGRIEELTPDSDWKHYVERLKMFFKVNSMPTDKNFDVHFSAEETGRIKFHGNCGYSGTTSESKTANYRKKMQVCQSWRGIVGKCLAIPRRFTKVSGDLQTRFISQESHSRKVCLWFAFTVNSTQVTAWSDVDITYRSADSLCHRVNGKRRVRISWWLPTRC